MVNISQGRQKDLDIQIVVGIIGLVMSVVLHELFHIAVHWGQIQHISLFPNLTTIVQIDLLPGAKTDIEGEEGIAYAITFFVILITAMIIYKIRDRNDDRSATQILFPEGGDMQKLNPSEILELSGLDEIGPVDSPPVSQPRPKPRKKSKKRKSSKVK